MINRTKIIQEQEIARANLSKNKYNFPMLHNTEVLTGEPSDRTAYDVGTEMEPHNFDHDE